MEGEVAPLPLMAASRLEWDVFLSFRAEDTRKTITKALYEALSREGVRVFIDDEGLSRGDEIAKKLLEAIRDSEASIVVLSQRYADSHWCLRELAEICESRRLILPVFYGVDPSHVRKQKGTFEKPFRDHEERFGANEVLSWRQALTRVGGIAGFTKSCEDQQLIQEVVKSVLTKLRNTPENVAAYPVGLDARLKGLMNLVDVRSNTVQVLGLYGMGGIGKTTLAKALYNKLVGHFENRIFMSNIREESSKPDGLTTLQSKLIHELFKVEASKKFADVDAGLNAIKEKVSEKKVLIVLDDVDDVSQLHALAGEREWFGEGTLVVITTRNQPVLSAYNVNHCYEVGLLNDSQALELFSFHALRRQEPMEIFLDLSKQIVSRTGGLPLALEVFGSFLLDKRRKEEWEDALLKLKKFSPGNLHNVLKISYDALDNEERCIFLDIACLFTNMKMNIDEVVDVVKGCGFSDQSIRVLQRRSLIKIVEHDTLWMHDQVKDMGRRIVLEENLMDPSRRSRLWVREEIMTVLNNNKGTEDIQGIVLDFEKSFVKDLSPYSIAYHNFQSKADIFSATRYYLEKIKRYLKEQVEEDYEAKHHVEPLKSMANLRLLQINHVKLEGMAKILSPELKWLQWRGCTLKRLPSQICPPRLAVLDLAESKIKRLWGSWGFTKEVLKNLTVLNLKYCYNLETLPDLSECEALEKLVLEGCHHLVKVHKSVGSLRRLIHLNLRTCKNLVEFPKDVSGLHKLGYLNLSGCSKLKELPENIRCMTCLKELLIDETAITDIPESIFHLVNLEKLSLKGCKSMNHLPVSIGRLASIKELDLNQSSVQELPASVGSLTNLERLNLMWCESLNLIPDCIGNLLSLKELLLNGSAIKELPDSLSSLPHLEVLSAGNCKSLSNLPGSIGGLEFLFELQLDYTPVKDLPLEIGSLTFVRRLEIRNCRYLSYLPESIGGMDALRSLYLSGSNLVELPESIGMLEKLAILWLNGCKNLCKLPDSIGNLKSLHHLHMQETSVAYLPESFGNLSNLMVLKMLKKPLFRSYITGENRDEGTVDTDEVPKFIQLPTSFSNLHSLEELDARSWRISGKIPDDFENLSSLQILNLGNNYFHSLPCSLRGLSLLKKLLLYDCRELKSLPPLPSSLQELNAANCISLESVSDLSNLELLGDLNLTNCEKVVDIPGLECLKRLRRLYMSGCNVCSRSVKRRLSKASLKQLRNLSMPGSKIPAWFSGDTITYSTPKNRDIKGVIIAVVVSLDHQEPDELRYQIPAVVDIQARVLKMDLPIFTHALQLFGVPRTNDDQIHLCRYPASHQLALMLKNGYTIEVMKRDPPYIKGIQLKKSGIYLIFDHDDQYDGDESTLDERHHTISQKLANFFGSLGEDDTSGSSAEDGICISSD